MRFLQKGKMPCMNDQVKAPRQIQIHHILSKKVLRLMTIRVKKYENDKKNQEQTMNQTRQFNKNLT